MPLEDSPNLDQFSQGLPPELPADAPAKNKRLRGMIFGLLVLVLVLGSVRLVQSRELTALLGSGVVTGQVVDGYGQPVQAEVFVLPGGARAQSGVDGRFEVLRVPAGEHTLLVGYQGSGFEYPLQVPAGGSVDVGKVKVTATQTPE